MVNGIAIGNGRAVVIGWEGWPRVSSNLGLTWNFSPSEVITPGVAEHPGYTLPMVGSDITFGNGTFLVARGFLGNGFLTTADGVTWVSRDLFLRAGIESVAYGNGTFVALCTGGAYPPGIYQSMPTSIPCLTAQLMSNSNTVVLNLSGEVGRRYRLQTSSDFQTWTDLRTYTNDTPTIQLVDPDPPEAAMRFYRAVSP